MALKVRELRKSDWPHLEALFGPRGACGGCWCMSWRREKGEKWDGSQGPGNKRRFKALVTKGKAHGVLAFEGSVAVGWCSFDRRGDFPRLDRAPSLKCDDAEKVWSIPCFFIKAGYRKRGVATAMLGHAVKSLRARKAQIIEGYPARSYSYGKAIPAAFAWTGTESLFKKAGFAPVGPAGGKQRYRLGSR